MRPACLCVVGLLQGACVADSEEHGAAAQYSVIEGGTLNAPYPGGAPDAGDRKVAGELDRFELLRRRLHVTVQGRSPLIRLAVTTGRTFEPMIGVAYPIRADAFSEERRWDRAFLMPGRSYGSWTRRRAATKRLRSRTRPCIS